MVTVQAGFPHLPMQCGDPQPGGDRAGGFTATPIIRVDDDRGAGSFRAGSCGRSARLSEGGRTLCTSQRPFRPSVMPCSVNLADDTVTIDDRRKGGQS